MESKNNTMPSRHLYDQLPTNSYPIDPKVSEFCAAEAHVAKEKKDVGEERTIESGPRVFFFLPQAFSATYQHLSRKRARDEIEVQGLEPTNYLSDRFADNRFDYGGRKVATRVRFSTSWIMSTTGAMVHNGSQHCTFYAVVKKSV